MKNIVLVCGGYSGEFVISVQSAETVMGALDVNKYRVFKAVLNTSGWKAEDTGGQEWIINRSDFSLSNGAETLQVDGVINVIHGTPGEDGKLQGYFDILGIPYNGSDVLTSSLTFNKGFCNHYLKQQGISVANSILLTSSDDPNTDNIVDQLGLPCFVKPNDGGSSIGVTKVTKKEQLLSAIQKAFDVSDRVLIESFVDGVEITCGVISQNGEPRALAVTEIVFENDFFDFEAKYNDASTQEITPARIDEIHYRKTMELSAKIYTILGCRGFFRADYILSNGELYLIEVNTVPGMSKASLMPQQLAYAKVDLGGLLDDQISQMLG